VGDRTIKKRPRFAAFAPTPDSLLAKAAAANQMETTVADGLATPAGSTTNADLTAIGEFIGLCCGVLVLGMSRAGVADAAVAVVRLSAVSFMLTGQGI
jgi:hypothetical protein